MSLPIDTKYIRLVSSRLRNFKQKNSYLFNFSCPYCGDSQKNKSKARGYIFPKGNDLIYKCHNCGVGANVGNFLKHIDSSLYREYTLEKYKTGESNNSYSANTIFNIQPPKFGRVEKAKVFEHAEWCDKLPSGHYCLEYLSKRQIPKQFYNKLLFTQHYKQFVDALVLNHGKQIVDDARLIIPFYNEYDDLIAVSGRALETSDKTLRYVTIRTNDSENKLIYGMDRINLNQSVKILEGPIDSMFLTNCVASGDANLTIVANEISSDEKLLIFDNEPRNKEIVKMMQDAIKLDHNVVIWPNNIKGKDINEMIIAGKTVDEIEKIISSNSFRSIEAQLRFNMWKKI